MTTPPAFTDRAEGVSPIDVTVNGDGVRLAAFTLGSALFELGFDGVLVATAVNGAFVPAAARAGTALVSGDKIEIVAPRAGG
jgi:sulfur carrier protein